MAQIQTLKKGDETIYPLTHMKGVVDDNGNTMDVLLAKAEQRALRKLFIAAGAEYNDTNNHIVKDTPWKAYVDSVDYKAQWDLDVVTGSVQTLTYGGKTYEYVDDNGTWKIIARVGDKMIWDDTKVIHRKGYYYLNGLGDITEEQMMHIYIAGIALDNVSGQYFNNREIRTFIPTKYYNDRGITDSSLLLKGFCSGTTIEVALFYIDGYKNSTSARSTNSAQFIFSSCKTVRHAALLNVSTATSFYSTYTNTQNLVDVLLNGLKAAVDIKNSPKVTKCSILYTIQNAKPTSAITITLHADAYNRLANDADIVAALAAQPLITLVSA